MKSTLKDVWFWVTVALLVLFLLRSCGKGNIGFIGCNKNDTLSHKVDTTINQHKDSIVYVPVPYKVDSQIYVPQPYEVLVYTNNSLDPVDHPEYEAVPVPDTCKKWADKYNMVLTQYKNLYASDHSRKYYLIDTTFKGTRIKVMDTVSNNRITGRKIVTETADTTVKETTTILKHKLILYFGLTAFGSKSDFFHGGLADLSVKGKNDMQYSFGVGKIRVEKELYYTIGVRLPIRLFKRN